MSAVVFRTCDLYKETLIDKARAYPIIGQKMQEFRQFKAANPLQSYGASDKPFIGDQIYGGTIKNIRHAHLTHDIMVVYTISGRDPIMLDLYGIFSHDELGIGQPKNIKRQKAQAKRMANQQFTD